MVINEKEKTALATSVGADERQSVQNTNNIISTCNTEINYPDENSSENLEEIYRQMRRMADPYYLHTVSMTPAKFMKKICRKCSSECLIRTICTQFP